MNYEARHCWFFQTRRDEKRHLLGDWVLPWVYYGCCDTPGNERGVFYHIMGCKDESCAAVQTQAITGAACAACVLARFHVEPPYEELKLENQGTIKRVLAYPILSPCKHIKGAHSKPQ